jgi:hypothetical protein
MNNCGYYVLMLVYIDEKRLDIGNNIYPLEGYIEAQKFTRDINIRYGLYGIMWGKTYYFSYEKIQGNWAVVKIEMNDNVIKVDGFYNRYKFNNGFIVHSGTLASSAKYIIKNKNSTEYFLKDGDISIEEIAGSKEWFKKYQLRYSHPTYT